VEIVLGKIDTGATFGNERPCMTQPSQLRIELMAAPRAEPDTGDASFGEALQKLWKSRQRLAGDRKEVIDGA
jgi:hypothetical protein